MIDININKDIIDNEKAQETLQELLWEQYKQYVQCIYNLSFIPARLEATKKDLENEQDADMKRQLQAIILKNEKDLESNVNWMKQYEETIPYFKTLIK